MYTSRARGGPLSGIKVSAPGSWDGLIRKSGYSSNHQYTACFHAGRYMWGDRQGWTWFPGKFEILNTDDARHRDTRNWRLVIE